MNVEIGVVIAILTVLMIATACLFFCMRSLFNALHALRGQISQIEVGVVELRESNKRLLEEQKTLKAEISPRDAYEAYNNDYQQAVDCARDRLSLQTLRQKFGISSSLLAGDQSDSVEPEHDSRHVGSES